jgi:hypothetical protein
MAIMTTRSVRMVANAGYRLAVTTERGWNGYASGNPVPTPKDFNPPGHLFQGGYAGMPDRGIHIVTRGL